MNDRTINEKQAALMRKKRESAREIGFHSPCQELKTKKKLAGSLLYFLKTIFPRQFYRPFSKDQLVFIDHLQDNLEHGGQDCIAMARGDGKTTIMRGGTLWAVLTGKRRFPIVIASDQVAAEKIIDAIQVAIENNEMLARYYPEACHYARALEGLPQRAAGQLAGGNSTLITWGSGKIQFAQVPMDAKKYEFCSGATIEGYGITGGIRGQQKSLANGEIIRPDQVLLDDPQTRETANSSGQTQERLDIINADLAGLVSVEVKLAMLAAVTVIKEGDLADKLLASWRAVRAQALNKWPREKDGLWQEYITLRRDAKRKYKAAKLASVCNAFYKKNRKSLDAGAEVANKYRKKQGDVSALQACFNYIADNGIASFNSEWQNSPRSEANTIYKLTPDIILKSVNGRQQGVIPENCHYVNAGIDINFYAMGWTVVASQNDMASYVVDYGLWPGRGKELWSDASPMTLQQAIFEGVRSLIKHIIERNPSIKLFCFDGNFETTAVYSAIAQARQEYKGVNIFAARGVPAEKYSLPYRSKDLIRRGGNCHLSRSPRGLDHIIFDSHYWHMQTQKGFLLSPGAPGSVSLFGDRNTPHMDFANHVCADMLLGVEEKAGRIFYKWTKRAGEKNELGDALAMATMASSIFGADINVGGNTKREETQMPLFFPLTLQLPN